MNTAKKVYSAQALAIVMIVLVISVVMGMAMLSRVLRDNLQSVNEKSSAEALETTDAVFDAVKGTSVSNIKTTCSKAQYGGGLDNGGTCTATGTENVKAFLTDLGVAGGATEGLNNCQSSTSQVELKTTLAGANDDLEIRPDSVRSFVLRGQVPNPSSCNLELTVEPRGSSMSGLMISKVYGQNYVNGIATTYKPYANSDISPYCIYGSGADCAASPNYKDTWTAVASGSKITIPLGASGAYSLDEIRVRSVNSVVSIKANLSSPNCIKDWEMVKMVVGANCTGSYRAKEVQIPQKEWALPIFDYVLYNGTGILKAE